jgi:EpsI family protein
MSHSSVEPTSHFSVRDARQRAVGVWLIALCLAGLVAYLPTFLSLAVSYTGGDSYYAHWFLIPPVSAFFVWLKKDKLRQLPVQSCRLGLPLMAGSLFLHVFAVWFRIDFVSAFSLVVTIWGLALYLFGKRIVRELSFPLLFLFFMVPLPELAINPLAFRMKILSGKLAVSFHNLWGGSAILSGSSIIFARGERLWLGYECSGLRSLLALAALGAAFGYLAGTSRSQKTVMFLLSLPLAVLSNTVRVTSLCFAASRWGTANNAFKVVHDIAGLMVFIIMLIGLFGVHKVLSIANRRQEMECNQADSRKAARRAGLIMAAVSGRRLRTAFGLSALSAILVLLSPHSMIPRKRMSLLKPAELPERIGPWHKRETESIGDARLWSILSTKSIVLGTYEDAEGKEIQVLVVASDTNREAFHPPEICMMVSSDRNTVTQRWKESLNFDARGPKHLRLNAFILTGAGDGDIIVMYWFMVGERTVGSRLQQQLLLLLNGARKTPVTGAMVRVTCPLSGMSQEEGVLSAKRLIGALVPLMPSILESTKQTGSGSSD